MRLIPVGGAFGNRTARIRWSPEPAGATFELDGLSSVDGACACMAAGAIVTPVMPEVFKGILGRM